MSSSFDATRCKMMQVQTFCRQGLSRPSCFAVIYTGNRRLHESRIVARRVHEACSCRSLQMSHSSHITRPFQAFIRHLHGSFAWRRGTQLQRDPGNTSKQFKTLPWEELATGPSMISCIWDDALPFCWVLGGWPTGSDDILRQVWDTTRCWQSRD